MKINLRNSQSSDRESKNGPRGISTDRKENFLCVFDVIFNGFTFLIEEEMKGKLTLSNDPKLERDSKESEGF